MDIYFSTLDRKQLHRIPVIPPEMPELTKASKNEEFEGLTQIYNILGNVGLVTFSLDCFLPEYAGKYTHKWCKNQINPYLIINLWSNAMIKKTPIKCIMLRDDGSEILNWQVSVENMQWHPDQTGDIKYKVDFKEYPTIE